MALAGTVPLVAEFRRRLNNHSKSWKFHRASNFKGRPRRLFFVRRISLRPGVIVNLLHQSLERTPAHLAKVSIVIRHQLLACGGAIDVDVSPSQVVVRFPEAAIADEGRFRSHASD
jgi:hypothetical protein